MRLRRWGWRTIVATAATAATATTAAAVMIGTMAPAANARSQQHDARPQPGDTCTWGGTAAAPTGTFTIDPGLESTPSVRPSRFFVRGALACRSGFTATLTYVGQIDAGATCAANTFEGMAEGIPGVRYFVGVGAGPLGPARLYSAAGDLVASDAAWRSLGPSCRIRPCCSSTSRRWVSTPASDSSCWSTSPGFGPGA